MNARIVIPVIMVLPLLLPSRGYAQTPYVGGGGGVGFVSTDHLRQEAPLSRDTDTSGATGIWFVQGGGPVTHGVVWQTQWSRVLPFARVISPAIYEPPCATCLNREITVRRWADEVAAFAGYRIGRTRVAATPLAGVIIVRQRLRRIDVPVPAAPVERSGAIAYTMTPAFGIDGEIPLHTRLVLAPQARIHLRRDPSFSGGLLETSLQLAVRWTMK